MIELLQYRNLHYIAMCTVLCFYLCIINSRWPTWEDKLIIFPSKLETCLNTNWTYIYIYTFTCIVENRTLYENRNIKLFTNWLYSTRLSWLLILLYKYHFIMICCLKPPLNMNILKHQHEIDTSFLLSTFPKLKMTCLPINVFSLSTCIQKPCMPVHW